METRPEHKRVLPCAYLSRLCPCRECTERAVGCRSGCARWAEWSAAWAACKTAIYRGRMAMHDPSMAATMQAAIKNKKRNR